MRATGGWHLIGRITDVLAPTVIAEETSKNPKAAKPVNFL